MHAAFDKNRIKIAAFDLDGTIYDGGELLDATREAIERLGESGVETIISTGRHPFFLPEKVMAIGTFRYAVAANGAMVADIRTGELFSCASMSESDARDIARFLNRFTDKLHAATVGGGIMTRADFDFITSLYPERDKKQAKIRELERMYSVADTARELIDGLDGTAVKIACRLNGRADLYDIVDTIRGSLDAEVVVTDRNMVEVSPRGVSKGVGLELLCGRLGVSTDDVVVFGDSGNDADIMKRAGYSVAVGNASADIKAIADYVADTVTNAGVAKAIEALFEI